MAKSTGFPQVVPWRAWPCTCTVLDVPGVGGDLWDELMGLVTDPTPDEPTDEPRGVVVGRLNDDDTYEHRPEEEIYADQHREALRRVGIDEERVNRLRNAVWSCQSMGLQIVYEGDDISEVLGLAKASSYLQNGVWHLAN